MSRITESLYSKYGINERKPLRESRKNRKLYERVSYPEDRMIAKNIEWDMDAIKLDKDAFDTEEEYLEFVKSLPKQVDLPKDIAYEYYYEFDDDEEEEAEEFVKDWISEWYGAGYPIKSLNIGERGMMLDSFNKKSLKEARKRNKKFLKEGMFDDIAENLGYTIYEEDQYGTMYTKTHHVYKNGRDVDWLSIIEVTNDGQCHVDIYDENEYQVGSINSDSFEKAVKYVDKVIRIKQDNPYATIYESYLEEELATPIGNISDKEVKQKLKSAQNLIKERGTEDHIYAINVAYYVKNNRSAYPGFGEVSSEKEYRNRVQQVCNAFNMKEHDILFKTVFNKNKTVNEEWLAEDSFNVEDFVSGFKGTTKFKIIDAEDDVFVCSGNILDGKIVNIQDLVIDKNKISSLIITSFTIDPKNGTLVLYSYVPEDLF